MKDEVLFSITKVVDDDTGIYSIYSDYDFGVTAFGLRHGQRMTEENIEAMRKVVDAAIKAMTKRYV